MNRSNLTATLIAAFAAVAGLAIIAGADERMDIRRDAVVQAVEKASPAVVNISTETIMQRGFFEDSNPFGDPFFDQFMQQFRRPEIGHSLGSGGIFTSDGYIFTNAHVVDRASKITVTLADATQFPAELVAVDVAADIAVLKIKSDKPLPTLVLGRSDDLMVGEKAIAVGNPFGLSGSVTQGVVSATHRDVVVEGRVLFKDFLQTDALINPGNSGGPLLNVFGEVVGVNSAMRSDAQGIGFAIPIDKVRASLAEALDVRRLKRMKLGAQFEEKYIGAGPEAEVVVTSVEEGGAAVAAGLSKGDVITGVGGRKVSNLPEFAVALYDASGGASPEVPSGAIVFATRRGVEAKLVPTVVPKPDAGKLAKKLLGISIEKMDKSRADEIGISRNDGIVVISVDRRSPAAGAGIQAGDLILQVNETETLDLDSFAAALEAVQNDSSVQLVIERRHGIAIFQSVVEVPLKAAVSGATST